MYVLPGSCDDLGRDLGTFRKNKAKSDAIMKNMYQCCRYTLFIYLHALLKEMRRVTHTSEGMADVLYEDYVQ
jgi:hypothetical protein